MNTEAPSARDEIRAGEAVILALTSALFAGAGAVLWVVWRVFVTHAFSSATRDITWMAPLSFMVLILPPTLLALALTRLWPGRISWRLVVVVPAAIGLFGLLLLARSIHPLVSLLLALGLAFRFAYWFSTRPHAMSVTRYAAATIASLLLVASLAVRGLPALAEARVRAGAVSSSADQPNVLLIILDTVRAANMGLFGYSRDNTPELKRFAAEGILFRRAIAPASWTLPTHVSLFTGIDTRAALVRWQRSLEDSVETLAEVLGRNGFVSAGFTANTFYTTWETGLAQGFARWDDYAASLQETFWAAPLVQAQMVSGFISADDMAGRWRALKTLDLKVPRHLRHDRRPAAEIIGHFVRWQESIADKRFFAFINLFDAHDPYTEPPRWTPRYGPGKADIDTYDSAIAYMDDQLGRLFDTLRARGVLDRTVVIVSSDHGEQFGEHGLVNHGNSLYMNTIHVPLLVRTPRGAPAGIEVDVPVSLTDVPATVLDLAGVKAPTFPGRSLRDVWENPVNDSGHVVSWIEKHPVGRKGDPATAGPMTSIVDSRYHWIGHSTGRNELYAYRADSLELSDLHADSSLAGVINSFLRLVESVVR